MRDTDDRYSGKGELLGLSRPLICCCSGLSVDEKQHTCTCTSAGKLEHISVLNVELFRKRLDRPETLLLHQADVVLLLHNCVAL